jgi:hypothetical protein
MTPFDPNDPLLRLLGRLPPAAPDSARADRTRTRCAALLARRQHSTLRPRSRAHLFESIVVGGFCVVYFGAVILAAARALLVR